MPSPEDLAYIAGFFDGEGHVTVTRNRCHAREYLTVGCGLSNQNTTVLEWVKSLFGGNVYCVNPATEKYPKACYSWVARSRQMTTFLEAVLPYLRIKRRQAELGIAFQRGMQGVPGQGGTKVNVTVKEAGRRERIRVELRQLNAKSRFA